MTVFLSLLSAAVHGPAQTRAVNPAEIRNSQVRIVVSCGANCLWAFGPADGSQLYRFAPPSFPVDGRDLNASVPALAQLGEGVRLRNGVTEYTFRGPLANAPRTTLTISLQINEQAPVVRFRYMLASQESRRLTATPASAAIEYFQTSTAGLQFEEIQLSNFAGMTHSYTLLENAIRPTDFDQSSAFMGPILAGTDSRRSFLVAYEHGSPVPDAFLRFQLKPDQTVHLASVKGNYLPGQPLDAVHPYRTLWMETAAVSGDLDQLASAYRKFVLTSMSQNLGSRQPYIFYNTWNFQERNKWWNHRAYLDSMNEDRMLKEIDVAHKLGIEVFVLDTGWYDKTGDWNVSPVRFPHGLKPIQQRLAQYGMKLGLWFNPTAAAMSSKLVQEHPEWRVSWNGKVPEPAEIWETEKSYPMCMVSGYADAYADKLIELARQLGVTYFKWDAIAQYACNDPHHLHGTEANTAQERADSYAFQLVQFMNRVTDKVAAAIPGAIVDFDVTEGGRAMGLGFLASGKYFLINNGPYYQNYDVPIDQAHTNWNLFFYQGQARTWITRSPLTFDRWIPSVLFLTHYFPDDPQQWQEVNLASLVLGQNGIWGDLPNISEKGVAFLATGLSKYKQVRNDITASDPVVSGLISGSPEIHEKIFAQTHRGAVAIFATAPGEYQYFTRNKVESRFWSTEGVHVSIQKDGTARIDARFTQPGAKLVLFGVE